MLDAFGSWKMGICLRRLLEYLNAMHKATNWKPINFIEFENRRTFILSVHFCSRHIRKRSMVFQFVRSNRTSFSLYLTLCMHSTGPVAVLVGRQRTKQQQSHLRPSSPMVFLLTHACVLVLISDAIAYLRLACIQHSSNSFENSSAWWIFRRIRKETLH